jgi:adenylylsulfate kinase
MTGTIVWFTGLPASGKSTLAERTRAQLGSLGCTAIVLDGDAVRELLGADAYGQADRETFYRVLADLAVLIARQGAIVLVAATAHRRVHRDRARGRTARYFEVWVRASTADCEARDIKGLYARARRGELEALPGIGVAFEPPDHPDVTAEGGLDDAAVDAIARLVVAGRPSAQAVPPASS